MKQNYKFLSLFVAFLATFGMSVSAQYFTDYGTYTRDDRYLNSLGFERDGNQILLLDIKQGDENPRKVYFDKTANKIDIYPGSECKIVPDWHKIWMGLAVLVDYDESEDFDVNSTVEYVGKSNGKQEGPDPVTFTVPADQAIGEYRMRIMIDWVDDKVDEQGNKVNLPHANAANVPNGNLLTDNGGAVVDVILNVVKAPSVLPPTFGGVADEGGFVLLGDDRFTINSADGTTIKYTTDGTEPASSTTAVSVASNTTTLTITSEITEIKAISEKGGVQSGVASFNKIVKEAELGKEYHVVFQRNGAVSALTTGNPMTLEEYNIGQENQIFVFGKATTPGFYTLTAKNNDIVGFSDDRFRTPGGTAQELRIVQFKDTKNYEIERKDMPTEGMNPSGGFQNGKEIGDWNNDDLSNEVNFVEVPELKDVTVIVSVDPNSSEFGTVEIKGESKVVVTKKVPIKIKANPKPGHVFVKWTDGTNDYTTLSYTYTGTTDVSFIATFEKFGTGTGVVLTKDQLENKYFYIQSAGDGDPDHGNSVGDTRNNILYADGTEPKLKHGPFSTISDSNYALWFIEDGKLKNKGSQLYMTGSKKQDATGEELKINPVDADRNQYEISTGTSNPTCAWRYNTADRNSSLGADSMTAWYFVENSPITAIGNVEAAKNNVFVNNGIITVEGVDKFDVYNLSGQKVDAKNKLQQGVYIVKTNKFTKKVVVR